MAVTLIIEPDFGGHRFQAVANVARFANRTDEVVLLTSVGARDTDEFRAYLDGVPLKVREVFAETHPPVTGLARVAAELSRVEQATRVVVMDGDQALKLWWLVAPRWLRSLSPRPQVIFILVRYPTVVPLTDRTGWALRLAKGSLALLAMASGSIDRIGCYAGRDDLSTGWLVKRVRDPAICSAHSRDRVQIRAEFGLPPDRRIVGVLGVISAGKNVPMVAEAVLAGSEGTDLLVAGTVLPDVVAWLGAQPESTRKRIIVRDEYLSNQTLDKLVAACDVLSIAQDRNAPSGIMGKALAAQVPVVSAGSVIRAREMAATGGGVDAEYSVAGIAQALERLFEEGGAIGEGAAPPATGETFAAALLGVDPTHPARPAGKPPFGR